MFGTDTGVGIGVDDINDESDEFSCNIAEVRGMGKEGIGV